jgi:hypothetical protein
LMPTLVGLLIVVTLTGAASAGHADRVAASICIVGLSNEAHFAAASFVFRGRAVAQELVPRDSGTGRDTRTTFEVERVWKGESRARVGVRTCGGDGTVICGETFTFRVGEQYLVFAEGEPLSTNSCTLTGVLERSAVLVAWLNRMVAQ